MEQGKSTQDTCYGAAWSMRHKAGASKSTHENLLAEEFVAEVKRALVAMPVPEQANGEDAARLAELRDLIAKVVG